MSEKYKVGWCQSCGADPIQVKLTVYNDNEKEYHCYPMCGDFSWVEKLGILSALTYIAACTLNRALASDQDIKALKSALAEGKLDLKAHIEQL